MRQFNLPDGQQIAVVARAELPDLMRQQVKTSAVLVNADEPFGEEFVEQLVALHDFGCDRFLCSGALSERLHDAIDEQLSKCENAEVLTTFHGDEEPLDDVIALFRELGAGQASRLLVYVRDSSSSDRRLLEKLESAAVA